MSLKDYFENAKGVGVLATADADGTVNAAVYARPHFLEAENDNAVSFIMNERLSYANVQTNPHAAYLFIEQDEGYIGKRLTLTRTGEEDGQDKIESVRRRNLPDACDDGKVRHLVHFRIDRVRPLIGTEE